MPLIMIWWHIYTNRIWSGLRKRNRWWILSCRNHRIFTPLKTDGVIRFQNFHDFEIKICKSTYSVLYSMVHLSVFKPMTINGQNLRMACITAASLNVSSSHPCNAEISLHSQQMLTIPLNVLTVQTLVGLPCSCIIDIYGNYSICETFIDVQNNDGSSIQINATSEEICNGQSTTPTVSGSTGSIVLEYRCNNTKLTVNPATTSTFSVSRYITWWLYFIGLQDHCSWSQTKCEHQRHCR